MRLVTPTDQQLDEAFATEVARWRAFSDNTPTEVRHFWATPDGKVVPYSYAKFAASADLVLPWLEKYRLAVAHNPARGWTISISGDDWDTEYVSEMEGDGATSFARNAVIALLRAHGVEIEFT